MHRKNGVLQAYGLIRIAKENHSLTVKYFIKIIKLIN